MSTITRRTLAPTLQNGQYALVPNSAAAAVGGALLRRFVLCVAGASMTMAGCSSDSRAASSAPVVEEASPSVSVDAPRSTEPSSAPPDATVAPTIAFATGELDVLIQLGEYDLGYNIDQFVREPEVVVYGSGAMYATVPEGIRDGAMQWRFVHGSVSPQQLQELLREAEDLPSESPVGSVLAVDSAPQVLRVNGRAWEINDLGVEPYRSFVATLRRLAVEAGGSRWVPTAWILRHPESGRCEVVAGDTIAPYYSAAVYPHLVETYPLGANPC